jgi:hypothetical protein
MTGREKRRAGDWIAASVLVVALAVVVVFVVIFFRLTTFWA